MTHPGAAPPWRVPRSPRWLMLAVLLLHGAALVGLQWASRPMRSTPASPGRLTLRWILESPPRSEQEKQLPRNTPQAEPRSPLAAPQVRAEPMQPDPPVAIPAAPAPQAITAAPTQPAELATTHPAPLRLDLPRTGRAAPDRMPEATDSPAAQARRDPRSNSAQGRGDRVERALDGGPATATEEDRGPGRRRYRLGRDCVDVRESRAAGLDPFSASTRPMPKLAEPCRQ